MKSEVRYIELVLENVETIIINISDIESMSLFNVCEKHSVGISSSKSKNIEIIKECSKCILCLKKTADVFKGNLQGGMNVFERLTKYKDIVWIDYLDSDKKVIDSIYVPWNFDEQKYYTNSFQTSELQEDGSLIIVVQTKETIKEWTLKTMKKYPKAMKVLGDASEGVIVDGVNITKLVKNLYKSHPELMEKLAEGSNESDDDFKKD